MMSPQNTRRAPRPWPETLTLVLLQGVLALILVAQPMDQLVAQNSSTDQNAPLQIEKGFFKGTKFIYRGGEPEKVSGWFGYTEAFTDLMGRHPTALEELNRAKPWQVGTLIGSAGMLAVSIKMLMDTLEDVDDVQSGSIDSDTGNTSRTDVGLLAGFGAVMVVSAIKANGHFKEAVNMFNRADGSQDGLDWKPTLDLGLRTLDGRPALAVGLSIAW